LMSNDERARWAGRNKQQHVRSKIQDEVKGLASDQRDREEMRAIREQLEKLAPRASG
jgi:hypothetical protein